MMYDDDALKPHLHILKRAQSVYSNLMIATKESRSGVFNEEKFNRIANDIMIILGYENFDELHRWVGRAYEELLKSGDNCPPATYEGTKYYKEVIAFHHIYMYFSIGGISNTTGDLAITWLHIGRYVMNFK